MTRRLFPLAAMATDLSGLRAHGMLEGAYHRRQGRATGAAADQLPSTEPMSALPPVALGGPAWAAPGAAHRPTHRWRLQWCCRPCRGSRVEQPVAEDPRWQRFLERVVRHSGWPV